MDFRFGFYIEKYIKEKKNIFFLYDLERQCYRKLLIASVGVTPRTS